MNAPARILRRNGRAKGKQWLPYLLLFGVLGFLPGYLLMAQDAGERVIKQGVITEDLYVAGGEIQVDAVVEGDVTAAGGDVVVERVVKGDVIAAGGTVTISAEVWDDIRAAGGDVTVSGSVGDDAILAGGSVRLLSGSSVGGRAWLAGGDLEVAGGITKELKAAGGRITISGEIDGDVELRAESISILPSARISGNFKYSSPNAADIAEGAQILGQVTREPYEEERFGPLGGIAGSAVFFVSLALAGIVLYLLFPRFSVAAATIIREAPLKSLGLGLALLVTAPFAVLLLMVSVIGIPLALVLAALYCVALLVGFLTAALFVGDAGFRLLQRKEEMSRGERLLSLAGALLLIFILKLIPIVGGVVVFALLLFGLGALTLQTYRSYSAGTPGPDASG